MSTFSLCMIVKNEEKHLRRCLDSICDLMDEIIIVDTGSTDSTKEIAKEYTSLIYDFKWINDFSAARNFAFSKATKDYIYTADADEMLDAKNHKRLAQLKEVLLPDVEIVQMHYLTKGFNTTQNFEDELRPKLYKRLRTFTWIHPIHETVRLLPLVFDSDIEIIHMPDALHNARDFSIFKSHFEKEHTLPAELFSMYAKELFISGSDNDFLEAEDIVSEILTQEIIDSTRQEAMCILSHIYLIEKKYDAFFPTAFKTLNEFPCSEICYELGCYYKEIGDKKEALYWFSLAKDQTEPVIDIRRGGEFPDLELAAISS